MAQTISRHLSDSDKRGYTALCDYCGVLYMRRQLRRDGAGFLACPTDFGPDQVTLNRTNQALARGGYRAPRKDGGRPDQKLLASSQTFGSLSWASKLTEWWDTRLGLTLTGTDPGRLPPPGAAPQSVSAWVGQARGVTLRLNTTYGRVAYVPDDSWFYGQPSLLLDGGILFAASLSPALLTAGAYPAVFAVIRWENPGSPGSAITMNGFASNFAGFEAYVGSDSAGVGFGTNAEVSCVQQNAPLARILAIPAMVQPNATHLYEYRAGSVSARIAIDGSGADYTSAIVPSGAPSGLAPVSAVDYNNVVVGGSVVLGSPRQGARLRIVALAIAGQIISDSEASELHAMCQSVWGTP